MEQVRKLVSDEERMNMPYKEHGTDFKIKIVDVETVGRRIKEYREKRGMSPFINIEVNKIDKHKDTNYSFTFDKDMLTGIYYGIVSGSHPDGNPKWFKINLKEKEVLNLNHDIDLKKWVVLRMAAQIEGSPLATAEPKYKVFDAEIEAEKKIDKGKAIRIAIERAEQLKGEKLIDFARFLGIEIMHGMNSKEVRSLVIDQAITEPIEFNRKWDSGLRGIHETFHNGVKGGIISHDYNSGYKYKDITLGLAEEECVFYLEGHIDILTAINIDVRDKDMVRKEILAKGKVDFVQETESEKPVETKKAGRPAKAN